MPPAPSVFQRFPPSNRSNAHLTARRTLSGVTDFYGPVNYLSQAGDRARGLYAHQEAVDCYRRALALLKEQGEHAQAARTLMKLGLTYHNAFDFKAARQAYEEGFVLWQRAGEIELTKRPAPAPHTLRLTAFVPFTLDPGLALGAFYAARGNVEATQREYQRAIDLDAEGFFRQRAEKTLEEL